MVSGISQGEGGSGASDDGARNEQRQGKNRTM